jgi:hypothetical protein
VFFRTSARLSLEGADQVATLRPKYTRATMRWANLANCSLSVGTIWSLWFHSLLVTYARKWFFTPVIMPV